MNQVFVCAQAVENPTEIYLDSSRTALKVKVQLPPLSASKRPTELYYHIYKDQSRWRSLITSGTCLFIHGAKLQHDLDAQEHSIHGGNPAIVDDSFPIYNTVLLTGRMAKPVDQNNSKSYVITDQYIIANTSMTVSRGNQQADLFNLCAISKADDRFKLAEFLANTAPKGTGITIRGQLVTSGWFDHDKKQDRTRTNIQLQQVTLAPKSNTTSSTITPTTTINSDSQPKPLWGGRTAESMAESPHQAAIATPMGQVLQSQQSAPAKPMAIAEPWDDTPQTLPPLPNDKDPF